MSGWGGADSLNACAVAVSTAVEVAKEKKEKSADTVAHFLGIPRVLSLAFVSMALLPGLHQPISTSATKHLGEKSREGD